MKAINPRDIKTEPILREEPLVPSGIAIWAVILWLKQLNWDHDKTLDIMEGALTKADVDFAERYYRDHRDEIDHKLNSL